MPVSAQTWQCAAQPERVHDGDTISLRCASSASVIRVRLANIDAPELHQAYGPEASAALRELTAGQTVVVDAVATDRYGRVVASLSVAGHDLGLQLVARGLAWCGLRPSRKCHRLQADARDARRGLWAQADAEPPWQWRRAHPRTDP